MAQRSRTTFTKRQKEQARAEKQRDKAAKRLQRKEDSDRPSPLEEEIPLLHGPVLVSDFDDSDSDTEGGKA
ncbi:MAG: hypothetical protein QM757_38065 [Paludibaculum sp.]|nr:hypothetical protein [Acidobacteriota bacterium]